MTFLSFSSVCPGFFLTFLIVLTAPIEGRGEEMKLTIFFIRKIKSLFTVLFFFPYPIEFPCPCEIIYCLCLNIKFPKFQHLDVVFRHNRLSWLCEEKHDRSFWEVFYWKVICFSLLHDGTSLCEKQLKLEHRAIEHSEKLTT